MTNHTFGPGTYTTKGGRQAVINELFDGYLWGRWEAIGGDWLPGRWVAHSGVNMKNDSLNLLPPDEWVEVRFYKAPCFRWASFVVHESDGCGSLPSGSIEGPRLRVNTRTGETEVIRHG